ncbi:MAG: efflux RND transporter periplasmic adaptor subunit [Prevotella sp.]
MKLNIRRTIVVLSLTTAISMLTACSEKKSEKSSKVIVKTERPAVATGCKSEDYSFIAKPWRTSELSFRVSGPIDRLEVYAGNRYTRGSIIAEIDPRDFRIRKAKAEATYRQMEAEYRRVALLYDKNNVPASMYEKTKADYAAAKAAYDVAVNELNDTRLLAPFNGYIGEVYIEKFQDVKASQPVVTLIDLDKLKIEIFVTQDVAQTVQKSADITLVFDTEPDHQYTAKVIEVSKSTMSNNLSYMLTAMLPNADGHLLAGISGKAKLPSGCQTSSSISIPLSALCHRPVDGDFVWIVDKHKSTVSKRKVTRGQLLPNGKVSITSGLSANDIIATTGLRFLSDGTEVKVEGL